MITNPWINRITALVTMIAIYAIGYAGGKEQGLKLEPTTVEKLCIQASAVTTGR